MDDEAVESHATRSDDGPQIEKAKARLDQLVDEIRQYRDALARNAWAIGCRLAEIFEQDLWRVTDYRSFAEFVEKQCGFSRQTGKDFIRIAKQFPTLEGIFGLQVTHLRLLAKVADAEQRERLVEEVKCDQPTTRELAAKVKETRLRAYAAREAAAVGQLASGKQAPAAGLDRRTRPVRAGARYSGSDKQSALLLGPLANGAVAQGRCELQIVAQGPWEEWEDGAGFGRFWIGETEFWIDVLTNGEGFRIVADPPRPVRRVRPREAREADRRPSAVEADA